MEVYTLTDKDPLGDDAMAMSPYNPVSYASFLGKALHFSWLHFLRSVNSWNQWFENLSVQKKRVFNCT